MHTLHYLFIFACFHRPPWRPRKTLRRRDLKTLPCQVSAGAYDGDRRSRLGKLSRSLISGFWFVTGSPMKDSVLQSSSCLMVHDNLDNVCCVLFEVLNKHLRCSQHGRTS